MEFGVGETAGAIDDGEGIRIDECAPAEKIEGGEGGDHENPRDDCTPKAGFRG
jgi:hypothetical protein